MSAGWSPEPDAGSAPQPVSIEGLLVSPVSRFVGRPRDGLPPPVPGEVVERAEVRAGLGLVGDRYFGKRAHRDASITLFALESLDRLERDLNAARPGAPRLDGYVTRRNVLIRGLAVDALVGATIELDCGAGPVRLRVNRRANPCAWMDVALAPGAFKALRGRGGVRCTPLTDGVLAVGPVVVSVLDAASGSVPKPGGAVAGQPPADARR